MVSRIRADGLSNSTAIISAINAARTAAHPGAGKLVIFSTDDDGMLLWRSDRSHATAAFIGVPNGDPRHPGIIGIAQHGVVYTGGQAKIAEHGG